MQGKKSSRACKYKVCTRLQKSSILITTIPRAHVLQTAARLLNLRYSTELLLKSLKWLLIFSNSQKFLQWPPRSHMINVHHYSASICIIRISPTFSYLSSQSLNSDSTNLLRLFKWPHTVTTSTLGHLDLLPLPKTFFSHIPTKLGQLVLSDLCKNATFPRKSSLIIFYKITIGLFFFPWHLLH